MAFIRAGAAAPTAPGTRPGPGGGVLVSTGVAGIDAALGGGAPLGRLLALDAGPGCVAADWILRLFVAEGAAKSHPVLWLAAGGPECDSARCWLPSPAARRTPRVAPAGGDGGSDDGVELRIAWQYRRYLGAQGARAAGGLPGSAVPAPAAPAFAASARRAAPDRGTERGWCGDYDLLRRAEAPHAGVETADPAQEGVAAGAAAWIRTRTAQANSPPARLAVDATEPDAWDGGGPGVVRALWRLRAATRGTRIAALAVVCCDALPPGLAARALAAADGVLRADALASDGTLARLLADGSAACAALRVVAPPPPALGARAPPPAPGTALHVARARRGRLDVARAEVDPEADAVGGGGDGGGGAGGQWPACAPGPGGRASALDF